MVDQESRSLQFAVFINLIMALTGAIASWICNAQALALALDGLVSGLNARMILVPARLSSQLLRRPDRRDPFGSWALETLYTGRRSLLLLGTPQAGQELESQPIRLVEDAVFSSGRAVLGVLSIDPKTALSALDVDLLRDRLERTCRRRFENPALELVLSLHAHRIFVLPSLRT